MRRALAGALAATGLVAGCTTGAATPQPTTSVPSTPSTVAEAPTKTTAPHASTPAPPRTSATTVPATSKPAPAVPPVSAAQQKVGLLDVRTIVPDAIVDLQLATADNWINKRVYPADAKCLVHKSMKADLVRAAATLRAKGYRIVFWDCYRPREIQAEMFELVHHNREWIAPPGKQGTQHEVGRAIDISLAYKDGKPVDMGSGWCTFTPISWTNQKGYGLTKKQIANRMILLHSMESGGFSNYQGEFWHYNGPGSYTPRPHLNVPND